MAQRVTSCLRRIVRHPDDDELLTTQKEAWLAALVGFAVCNILALPIGVTRSDMVLVGTSATCFACASVFLGCLVHTQRLTPAFVIAATAIAVVNITLYDLTQLALARRGWQFYLVLMAVLLSARMPLWLVKSCAVCCALWTVVVEVELVYRFGMLDLPGLTPYHVRLRDSSMIVACSEPPCASGGALEIVAGVIQVWLALIMNYAAIRQAGSYTTQTEQALDVTGEMVAQLTASLRTFDIPAAAQNLARYPVPDSMALHFEALLEVLHVFRGYLPQSVLLQQMLDDDEDSPRSRGAGDIFSFAATSPTAAPTVSRVHSMASRPSLKPPVPLVPSRPGDDNAEFTSIAHAGMGTPSNDNVVSPGLYEAAEVGGPEEQSMGTDISDETYSRRARPTPPMLQGLFGVPTVPSGATTRGGAAEGTFPELPNFSAPYVPSPTAAGVGRSPAPTHRMFPRPLSSSGYSVPGAIHREATTSSAGLFRDRDRTRSTPVVEPLNKSQSGDSLSRLRNIRNLSRSLGLDVHEVGRPTLRRERVTLLTVVLPAVLRGDAEMDYEEYTMMHRVGLENIVQSGKSARGNVDYFHGNRVHMSFNAFRKCTRHSEAALTTARTIVLCGGDRPWRCGVACDFADIGNLGTQNLMRPSVLGCARAIAQEAATAADTLGLKVVCNGRVVENASLATPLRLLLHKVEFSATSARGVPIGAAQLLYSVEEYRDPSIDAQAYNSRDRPDVGTDEWMYAMVNEPGAKWEIYNEAGRIYHRAGPDDAIAYAETHGAAAHAMSLLHAAIEDAKAICFKPQVTPLAPPVPAPSESVPTGVFHTMQMLTTIGTESAPTAPFATPAPSDRMAPRVSISTTCPLQHQRPDGSDLAEVTDSPAVVAVADAADLPAASALDTLLVDHPAGEKV